MKNNKKNLFVAIVLLIFTGVEAQTIKVGVCDWMILKRQKLGEISLAKQIGADGVEMDMGGLGSNPQFKNKLRDDEASVVAFNRAADSLNIEIGAMAMSGFYGQSFATKETYKELIEDCLNTMDKMGGVKVAFLPLGGCGNGWTDDKALRKTIVKRLHEVGEMAKQRGKIIGIDTPLDAAGNLKLLKEIKSDGIRIFYKWQTAVENNRDICAEIKKLGAKNIAAFHSSSIDSVCLRDDKAIDAVAIINTLKDLKWSGWFFVERSRDVSKVKDVRYNYSNNVNYLKDLLGTLAAPEVALDSVGRDAQYVANILKRAQKVTDKLGITYQPKGQNVLNIVANRYFELNDIYAERDTLKKKDKKLAQATADSKLYRSHFGYDAKLSMYLKPHEIETVKDVMTFNVLHVTFDAHCDMIPTLTNEEKAQIMAWLIEARELAIDAESSNKKHETFGKYKGRINNYLSARGYDLVKEREAWYERIKARGGSL